MVAARLALTFSWSLDRATTDGEVSVEAFDDEGVGYGPVTLAIGSKETVHLYSGDLEEGNVGKGFRLVPLAGEAAGDPDRHVLRAESTMRCSRRSCRG